MQDCDVIHIGRGEWLAPWAILHTITPSPKGRAVHSNYLFENIRFEEAIAFLGLQNDAAVYRNIVFKDITMNGNPVLSMVKSTVDGLTFDNVKVNGQLVRGKEDVPFEKNAVEIKTLVFRE